MSNYPPGVSGREFQIAGADYEETEHRDCHADVELRVIPAELYEKLADLGGAKALVTEVQIREMLGELVQSAASWPKVSMECPFEGFVTVMGYKFVHWWICPVCKTDHEEELEVD